MCVNICLCACLYIYVLSLCVTMEPKGWHLSVFLNCCWPACWDQFSSLYLELKFRQAGWPVGSRNSAFAAKCVNQAQLYFYMGAGDPDSGPCAFMASILPTERFRQPSHKLRTTIMIARCFSVAKVQGLQVHLFTHPFFLQMLIKVSLFVTLCQGM